MEISNQSLKFHSDALPENTLLLRRMHGWERLSGPFRFDLELITRVGEGEQPKIDLQEILYQPAKVGILQRLGGELQAFRWFAGSIESIEELEKGGEVVDGTGAVRGYEVCYRAVMVPDMCRLRECFRSRIFQQLTVDELVDKVLTGSLKLQKDQDFEFKLARTQPGSRTERPVYPEREYIVQYEENDLDFVDRWLQHEGIFYLFENDGTREKIVFADSSGAYKPVNAQDSSFPYRPKGSFHGTGSEQADKASAEDILSFSVRASRLPGKVRLNDYNWRDPSMSLASTKVVHKKGTGLQIQYNDHYKTPQQGTALSEVRAQELQTGELVFQGMSSCRSFRPGKTFELTEHFRSEWNQNYLITRVFHEASQSISLEGSNVTAADYRNTFEAIPASREFRPARTTGWPSIKGVMHARVDSEGEGDVAELDDHGRYKLRFPFDEYEADAAPGKASRWVRMAQPYAGPMAGMHFTLLKGTEVVVIHVDGDPDRPLIAGAVPNPEHVAPTYSGNPTQNQILTPTGNQFQMDDNEDSNGFVLRDANRNFVMDLRLPGGGGGNGGSGGGSGGEPRKRRPDGSRLQKKVPPRAPSSTVGKPPSGPRSGGPVTDPALQAELQAKLGDLPADAPIKDHVEAFRSLLGLDASESADRRARLQRMVAAGVGAGERPMGGGSGGAPTSAPAAVTVAAANVTPRPAVKLSWTGVKDASSYRVERAAAGSTSFAVLSTVQAAPPGATALLGIYPTENYTDTSAAWDQSYVYRVVAINSVGSTNSNELSWDAAKKLAQEDVDGDGTVEDVGEEFKIEDTNTDPSDDDEYDPRNTQSISVMEDFLRFCDTDDSCEMRSYYETGLGLLNGISARGDFGTVSLPGDNPIYQLWARKFNAWLQVAWGGIGEITINNCNQYEYVNNSYSIKFGTGGRGWDQQDGDSNNTKIVNGNQTDDEEIRGKQTKSSLVIGEVSETEIKISATKKASINIDATAEASITIGATSKASLELDAHASFALKIGAAIEIEISADASAKLEIKAGISFAIEISASAEFKIELKVTKTLFEALASKLSVVIPKTTEVKLEELEVKLQKTDAELNNTRNTLNDTKISLNLTKTQLNETKTQLANTETQLSQTQTKLSKQVTALNQRTTAMMEDAATLTTQVTTLSNNMTAALHTVS